LYDEGGNTYNSRVCIKSSISIEFEVDYYGKLQEVVELRYHRLKDAIFLFRCYSYDTDKWTKVDHHHDLIKINKKIDFITSTTFLFLQNNANKCWLIIHYGTKPRSHVQVGVIKDGNDQVIYGDGVF
jgi:hypothetical protein